MPEYLTPLNDSAKSSGIRIILTDEGFVCAEGTIAAVSKVSRKAKVDIIPPGIPFAPYKSGRFLVFEHREGLDVKTALNQPEKAMVPVYKVRVPKALSFLSILSIFSSLIGFFPFAVTVSAMCGLTLGLSLLSPQARTSEYIKEMIAIQTVIKQEFKERGKSGPEVKKGDANRAGELQKKSKELYK